MINRRQFIRNTTAAVGGLVLYNSSVAGTKTKLKLSFSTLGCPKWPLTDVLSFATKHGYDGIELRGIMGEVDLTKCPDLSTPERIAATKKMVADKNLKIVNLGASAALHHSDPEKRKSSLDDAKKFIDMAQKLDCPYIRVFPNNLPKDQDRKATLDLIAAGLTELGQYAKGTNVTVLLETHGDVVASEDILYVMKNSEGPAVGLIWDVVNMWSITKESPAIVYEKLKKYIRHTHIKDAKFTGTELHYVLVGQGETPIGDAVKLLANGNYKGFYSFEWEKLWHPEIEEPEIAIAAYPKQMQEYVKA